MVFEKAYCEYRLNRNADALKTLLSVNERSTAANELLAQVVILNFASYIKITLIFGTIVIF